MIIEMKKQAVATDHMVLIRQCVFQRISNHFIDRDYIINRTERVTFHRKFTTLQVISDHLRKAGTQGNNARTVIQLKIKLGHGQLCS
ncbi:hypothetical protein D9M68_973420 [compost metagenome]